MTKFRRRIQIAIIIRFLLLFSAFILLFQNCSKVSFESSQKLESSLLSRNGDAYGGKPSGDFYRYIPGFTCENKEAPAASIEISSSGIQLIENKKLLCGAIKQNIEANLIDASIYQNEVIGYQEGIFEGSNTLPSKIPANLVEVWCKDRDGEQGIETITHFDRTTNQAVNRIYYSVIAVDGSYGMKQTPDFAVARVLNDKTILIRADKGFELTVHRDQPAQQLGLFKAEMTAVIEGQKASRETSCRLGGSLDPKVWPALQVVDFDAKNFKFSPDFSHMVFTSDTATGISNLYTSDLTGTTQRQVGSNMRQNGIGNGWGNFGFSPDSQWIVYTGDPRVPGVMELFKSKVDGSNTTPLRIGLSSSNGIFATFKITNSSVIFETQNTLVQTVPLMGGAPIDLSPPPSERELGKYFVGGLALNENRVVYNFGDFSSQAEIYSVLTDGTGIQKITPPFATGDWKTDPYRNIKILAGNKYALTWRTNDSKWPNFKNYLVALDGSGSIELPVGMEVGLSSSDGNHVLVSHRYLTSFQNPSQLLNIKNGTYSRISAIPLSVFDPDKAIIEDFVFFTQDSRTLITPILVDDAGSMKAMSITTDTGVETELCPGLISKSIVIKEASANQYLISSYDQDSGILTIYQTNPNSSCQKLNSTVAKKIPSKSIAEVLLSPDRQKLLVRLGVFSGRTTRVFGWTDPIRHFNSNQLLYIPLNGRPALAIDTPLFDQAEITHASFLSDSRRVVFRGNQIKPGEYNVFLWTAP